MEIVKFASNKDDNYVRVVGNISKLNEGIILAWKNQNRIGQMRMDETRQQIIDWLLPCDPSTNHDAAKEKYVEGTGRWFIESSQFNHWKEGTKRSLWLHGIPGSGKTILCSTVIEKIKFACHTQSNTDCVYFYFDFNDMRKQTIHGFLRSVLVQLCTCRQDFITNIQTLFDKCNRGRRQPNKNELVQILFALLKGPRQTYLLLDALDECTERGPMAQIVKKLISSFTNLNMLITSRLEQDINTELQDYVDIVISIQSSEVKGDVEIYVRKLIDEDSNLKRFRRIREEVLTTLVMGADGMYIIFQFFR